MRRPFPDRLLLRSDSREQLVHLPQSRNNLPDDLELIPWVGRLLCLNGTVNRLAACAAERVDRRQPRSVELVILDPYRQQQSQQVLLLDAVILLDRAGVRVARLLDTVLS